MYFGWANLVCFQENLVSGVGSSLLSFPLFLRLFLSLMKAIIKKIGGINNDYSTNNYINFNLYLTINI